MTSKQIHFKKQVNQFFKIELNQDNSQVNLIFNNVVKMGSQTALLRANYYFSQELTPDFTKLSPFYKEDNNFKIGNDKSLTLTETTVIENSQPAQNSISQLPQTVNRMLQESDSKQLYVFISMYSD